MIELSEDQIETLNTATMAKVVKAARRRLQAKNAKQRITTDRSIGSAIYLEASLEMLALEETTEAKKLEETRYDSYRECDA